MVGDLGGKELWVSKSDMSHVYFGCSYEYGSNYLQRIGTVGGGGTKVTLLVPLGGGGLLAYPFRMSRELR